MNKKILQEAVKTFSEFDPAIKALIKDLLIAGGLVPVSKLTRELPPKNLSYWKYFYDSADTICDELRHGYFDFNAMDNTINELVNRGDIPNSPTTTYDDAHRYYHSNLRNVKRANILDAIAALAANMGIYWNDISDDPQRQALIDDVKANTLFGQSVNKHKRYKSQVDKASAAAARAAAKAAKAANKQAANTANTANTASGVSSVATTSTSTGARKDDYKYLGPLSGQVRDLKGTPGSKYYLANPVFIITGKNTNSARVVPYAYVANLIPLPSGKVTGNVGNTNKVFFGSANGYRQYPLCFSSQNEADAFLVDVQNNISIPSNMTDVHVARVKADQNGYFMIGTEFGDAYIRASELNESLSEEVEVKEENKKAITEEELIAKKEENLRRRNSTPFVRIPGDMLNNFND